MTTLTTPETAARYQRRSRFGGGAETSAPAFGTGGAGGGLTAGVVDMTWLLAWASVRNVPPASRAGNGACRCGDGMPVPFTRRRRPCDGRERDVLDRTPRPSLMRRVAAIGALALAAAGLILAVVAVFQEFPRGLAILVAVVVAAVAAWNGLLRQGAVRVAGLGVGVVLLVVAAVLVLTGDRLLEGI